MNSLELNWASNELTRIELSIKWIFIVFFYFWYLADSLKMKHKKCLFFVLVYVYLLEQGRRGGGGIEIQFIVAHTGSKHKHEDTLFMS